MFKLFICILITIESFLFLIMFCMLLILTGTADSGFWRWGIFKIEVKRQAHKTLGIAFFFPSATLQFSLCPLISVFLPAEIQNCRSECDLSMLSSRWLVLILPFWPLILHIFLKPFSLNQKFRFLKILSVVCHPEPVTCVQKRKKLLQKTLLGQI